MIKRNLKEKIINSLKNYPIVSIIGPRQVGKTTLAKIIKSEINNKVIYLDLELPSDLQKMGEAELYLKSFKDHLVIIDEIQRLPELFPLLRSLADIYNKNGAFLILGSASPDLKRQASESLAGRIIYHELTSFSILEIEDPIKLWERGGYPRSYLADSDELSYEWRKAFISTFLERDIPQLGFRIPSIQLYRFWQMIAHSHGQLWNASKISASLGISAPTARHYLDILQETFIIKQIQPYHPNIKKRLVKSPKIYIRDSGLLHSLLGINSKEHLLGHPSAGESWEGFVIEQISNLLPDNYDLYFYRTGAGAEMDIILVPPTDAPIAIEIKRTLKPSTSKGFSQAFVDVKAERGYIIYSGDEKYPLAKNVFALPLSNLDIIFE